MRKIVLFLAGLAVLPAVAFAAATAETEPPNAPDQRPAFPGQTRAPLPAQRTAVAVASVAEGLDRAWALEFLPDGRMLVTEKGGDLRIVTADGKVGEAIAGLPDVADDGQGGLLDLALSPDFASDGLIYFSFSEPREDGNGTSVASARLVEDGEAAELQDLRVIFRQTPSWDNGYHFGSRLVFAPDGRLFVTVGERSDRATRGQAQDLASGLGKVFRIDPDGTIPDDNPFADRFSGGRDGAQPAIWSYGHRNLQSATLDGEGRLWTVEHGPRGGDELNRPQAGLNYGWPLVTYGLDYSGAPIGEGITAKAGTEQPVYYWDPVIAPSGMAWYQGDEFPNWRGAFLIGGLVSQGLVVLAMEGDRVASEERIPLEARVRDVKVGPDGAVYVVTDGDSSILRLTAAD